MAIGKLLFKQTNFKSENSTNISASGNNRIKIEFNNYETPNQLIDSDFLQKNNLRGFIPEGILYRKAVIKNVDKSLDSEETMEVINTNIRITSIRQILHETH